MSNAPILYTPRNVLGGSLESCCDDPVTGFFRNGRCDVGPEDRGLHAVCILASEEFLAFSKQAGNDLSTPHPEWGFPVAAAGRPVVPVRRSLAGSLDHAAGGASRAGLARVLTSSRCK